MSYILDIIICVYIVCGTTVSISIYKIITKEI